MTSDARDDSGEALRAAAAALGQDLGPAALADAVASLAASLPDVGTVVGDYRLGAVIGRGGMGVVRQAEQVSVPGRKVAVKLLPGAGLSPVARQRFAREVEVIGRLDHPHIVPILSSDVHGSVPYFAMKFVAGTSLRDLVRDGSLRGEWRTIAALVRDLAAALAHAHSHGVVHRDVKPGNVLWSEERGAVLIDLGFAIAGSERPASGDTTAGTVHYIAPEQARGSGALDVRADIYALGATLYHLVTGSLPFEGRTSEEVLAKQVLESLSGERIRALNLSPQLHYFLEKMMAKEPEMRFQDPAHLQREVEAFLQQRRHEREVEEAQQRDKKRLGARRGSSMFERRLRRRRR